MTDLTDKQEVFAQAVASGKTYNEAYAEASPQATKGTCRAQGSAWAKHAKIKERIKALQKKGADKPQIDEADLPDTMGGTLEEIADTMDKRYKEAVRDGRQTEASGLLKQRIEMIRKTTESEGSSNQELIAKLQRGRKYASENYLEFQKKVADKRLSEPRETK